MCTPFNGNNLPKRLLPYLDKDPMVRRIVDEFKSDSLLQNSTLETILESICIAALNIKEDYFNLLLKEYERNNTIQIIK